MVVEQIHPHFLVASHHNDITRFPRLELLRCFRPNRIPIATSLDKLFGGSELSVSLNLMRSSLPIRQS